MRSSAESEYGSLDFYLHYPYPDDDQIGSDHDHMCALTHARDRPEACKGLNVL